MMAHSPLGDISDLTLCSFCKLSFNDSDQQPKVLACKHHFCLKCVNTVLLKGRELVCLYCWKRTEVPDMRTEALPTYTAVLALAQRLGGGGPPLTARHPVPAPSKHKSENCHTHAMPYTLWCLSCALHMCRACASQAEHAGHAVKPQAEAERLLRSDLHNELALVQKMLADIQHLVFKQRDFLLKILEACTTLKTQVETDLVNGVPGCEPVEARELLRKARLASGAAPRGAAELHALLGSLAPERERLQAKHHEMFLQCKLDDLIRNSGVIFDFDLLKRALADIHAGESVTTSVVGTQASDPRNPVLFLANYCMSQLYSRHFLFKQQQQQQHAFPHHNGNTEYPGPPPYVPLAMPAVAKQELLQVSKPTYSDNGSLGSPNLSKAFQEGLTLGGGSAQQQQQQLVSPGPPSLLPPALLAPGLLQHSPQATLVRSPQGRLYPVFYFNIEIDGAPFGRILIEVRNDAAPKMAKNFGVLATGELGIGYEGCNIFQCWENESIITGDFELNNGRGGRSVFEESFFMPDDTKILAVRGSVGMRRSQKRHDNLGLVGSQFRIILREMRGFTGIFAFVVEGLELVDRISQAGDSAGKPQSNIVIASCGKFN